jgi:hypothetical protein
MEGTCSQAILKVGPDPVAAFVAQVRAAGVYGYELFLFELL